MYESKGKLNVSIKYEGEFSFVFYELTNTNNDQGAEINVTIFIQQFFSTCYHPLNTTFFFVFP